MQPLRRRALGATQSGATLIEVLVAVAVVLPLTLSAAMGTVVAIRSSQQAGTQQELNVALTNATESLRQLPYVACGTTADYEALYGRHVGLMATDGTRIGAQLAAPIITEVAHWEPESGAYGKGCDPDGGVQRLTVSVAGEGAAAATGSIVISEKVPR